MDKEIIKKAKNVKSKEELMVLLKDNGVDITADKVDELYQEICSYGEIGDDDLDKVSGGGCYSPEGYLKTTIGYGCDLYERVEGTASGAGVEGTCYMCRYWNRDGVYLPLAVMGQTGKCMHTGNKR